MKSKINNVRPERLRNTWKKEYTAKDREVKYCLRAEHYTDRIAQEAEVSSKQRRTRHTVFPDEENRKYTYEEISTCKV